MGTTASAPAPAANAVNTTATPRRTNQGVTNANGLGPTPAPRTPAGYYGTEPAERPTMRTNAAGMGPRRQNVPAGAAAAPLGQSTPPSAAGAAGLRGGKRRRNQRKTKRNKSKSKKNKKSNKN